MSKNYRRSVLLIGLLFFMPSHLEARIWLSPSNQYCYSEAELDSYGRYRGENVHSMDIGDVRYYCADSWTFPGSWENIWIRLLPYAVFTGNSDVGFAGGAAASVPIWNNEDVYMALILPVTIMPGDHRESRRPDFRFIHPDTRREVVIASDKFKTGAAIVLAPSIDFTFVGRSRLNPFLFLGAGVLHEKGAETIIPPFGVFRTLDTTDPVLVYGGGLAYRISNRMELRFESRNMTAWLGSKEVVTPDGRIEIFKRGTVTSTSFGIGVAFKIFRGLDSAELR